MVINYTTARQLENKPQVLGKDNRTMLKSLFLLHGMSANASCKLHAESCVGSDSVILTQQAYYTVYGHTFVISQFKCHNLSLFSLIPYYLHQGSKLHEIPKERVGPIFHLSSIKPDPCRVII